MLCIHLGSITEQGLELNEQFDSARLPLLENLARNEGIRFTSAVQVHLHASFAGESVRIDGRAASAVRLGCSRCLTPFDLNITAEFTATAVPEMPSQTVAETADEIELETQEMEVIPYSGHSIDLKTEIAQQLIMALPFNPLCTDTCRGLCSRCGANLNLDSCQCTQEEEGNPFAVLKNLSLPPKKD